MRVLIVKVSSLGDVIHTLPALTDAKKAIPEIEFDWVVEEAFAEIPAWHPAVKNVIPVALRRWRKNILSLFFNTEYKKFKQKLKASHYDLVIDAQGLLKSGLICSLVPAKVVGLDKQSIRESLATRYYDESFEISWQQHAVERTRELFAKALGYTPQAEADYGISLAEFESAEKPANKAMLFLHGTTWETKLWPESYWLELTEMANTQGYLVNLLWGNENEQARAKHIADAHSNVRVLDRLSLSAIAKLMCQSECIVAVDTGLAHLAAALSRPTVALYGASDARRTGTYGKHQKHMQATLPCSPCLKKHCVYRGEELDEDEKKRIFMVNPPCFSTVTPTQVWQQVSQLMPEVLEM